MVESSGGGRLSVAVWLTVFVSLGWVVCFWPARYLRGTAGVAWMSFAAFSCLVPGWIVVFLSGLAILRGDLAAMLLQTMIRLLMVATVALVVRKLYPAIGFVDFFGWLVAFYVLALAVEVFLLKRRFQLPPR